MRVIVVIRASRDFLVLSWHFDFLDISGKGLSSHSIRLMCRHVNMRGNVSMGIHGDPCMSTCVVRHVSTGRPMNDNTIWTCKRQRRNEWIECTHTNCGMCRENIMPRNENNTYTITFTHVRNASCTVEFDIDISNDDVIKNNPTLVSMGIDPSQFKMTRTRKTRTRVDNTDLMTSAIAATLTRKTG